MFAPCVWDLFLIWDTTIAVPDTDSALAVQTRTSPRTRKNMEHAAEYGPTRADFTRHAGIPAIWPAVQSGRVRFLMQGTCHYYVSHFFYFFTFLLLSCHWRAA